MLERPQSHHWTSPLRLEKIYILCHLHHDFDKVWRAMTTLLPMCEHYTRTCTYNHIGVRDEFRSGGLKSLARIFFPLLAQKSGGFARILPEFLPENGYLKNYRGGSPPQPHGIHGPYAYAAYNYNVLGNCIQCSCVFRRVEYLNIVGHDSLKYLSCIFSLRLESKVEYRGFEPTPSRPGDHAYM